MFSSSIAEVLTAFLLGEKYEEQLLNDKTTKWGLIRNITSLVEQYARQETEMLIQLHVQDSSIPLFVLSEQSSELIFDLQDRLEEEIEMIVGDEEIVHRVLEEYIPQVLVEKLGIREITSLLGGTEMQPYRNTILTKKLASMAYYKFGADWQKFQNQFKKDILGGLHSAIKS